MALAGDDEAAYWGDFVAPAAPWPPLRRSMAPRKTRECQIDLRPWYSKKVDDGWLMVGGW